MKKFAFTLAETLIAMVIIGVVAAMILPQLIANFKAKVYTRQKQVIQRKINQGTEGMQVRGALMSNYNSTQDFIEELSKDTKIISVCDSNNLRKCWTYDEVNVEQNEGEVKKVKVSEQKNGKAAFMMNDDYLETAGVIFGNGVTMLLSYKKDCPIIDPDSVYGVDKNTGMSETSQCIAGIYDINGKKGPNKFGEDVVAFHANGFGGKACSFEVEDTCFIGEPFMPPQLSKNECENLKTQGKLDKDITCSPSDYVLGAIAQCRGKLSNIPSSNDFKKLAEYLYNEKIVTDGKWQPVTLNKEHVPSQLSKLLDDGTDNYDYQFWSSDLFFDNNGDRGTTYWQFGKTKVHNSGGRAVGSGYITRYNNKFAICISD